MKKVTMQDIANELGVSKMTVSKCFQNSDDISTEMKQKILDLANKMGYIYNKKVRYMVSVLVPEIFLEPSEEFYGGFYRRLNELAEVDSISFSLTVIKKSDEKNMMWHHDFNNVDAIMLLGQLDKMFVNRIVKMNIPTICVDFSYRNLQLDSIVSNNYSASYHITSYLLDKGHTKVAFVGNLNYTNSINDRFLGYYKALLEAGIDINPSYRLDDRNERGELVEIKLPMEMPTAFVCNNDHVAYLLIQNLKKSGYKIPEDVSVVGFDDVIYTTLSEPQITTMRVPRKYMAEQAIRLLLRRMKDADVDILNVNIECKMVERNSVAEPISS